MDSRPKVISYGENYMTNLGITKHSGRRKAFKAFLAIVLITILVSYLKLYLTTATKTGNVRALIVRHSNPCRHVTPEPEVILQEKFNSNDYFFPYALKERLCAATNSTNSEDDELEALQTCFTDQHHCVTRYQTFDVVRVPYPGNLTRKYWKTERIHIAVACECSTTEIVRRYET